MDVEVLRIVDITIWSSLDAIEYLCIVLALDSLTVSPLDIDVLCAPGLAGWLEEHILCRQTRILSASSTRWSNLLCVPTW